MLKHPTLTIGRLERFVDDHLSPQRLYGERVPLEASVCHGPEIRSEQQARSASFQPVSGGYQWGPVWSTAWFRLRGRAPDGWTGEPLRAFVELGTEATLWRDNCPREGVDRMHKTLHLEDVDEVDLILEAFAQNPNPSVRAYPDPYPERPCTVGDTFLYLHDARLWSFYYDFRVALQLLKELPQDEPRFGRLLYAMNQCVNVYLEEGIETARDVLLAEWNQPAHASAHSISAIGHAHIDTAWLWPLHITMNKCAHTFATATRYMEIYPEFKFVCSQAAQYEWIRTQHPMLFQRIQEATRRGQWEPTGSMWVEADCNLASGEALVRQFLYGKRYFMEHFGVETKDMWLPDVFGYAASLPQILKQAGIDIFMTQKISWNQFNKFPHHTFLWRGIDGTEVFSHFLPADDYNASMTPKQLLYNARNFRDHGRANRSLYVYGYGDGGGGPVVEMIEFAQRMRDIEGLPKVKMERAADFFEKAMEDARDLPVWVGELYLEGHRGTYTTQANNKKHNRKCELLLRDVELISALLRPAAEYPRALLDEAWKLTLLNQFHDILPGSSINEVYRDSDLDYARVYELLDPLTLTPSANAADVAILGTREAAPGGAVLLPVSGDYARITWENGESAPAQAAHGGTLIPDPPVGIGVIRGELGAEPLDGGRLRATGRCIENDHLTLTVDEEGNISSLVMKDSGQETMAAPSQVQIFDDHPNFWDAWDIDAFSHETVKPLPGGQVSPAEGGAVRATIEVLRRFGDSVFRQQISLDIGSPFVRVHNVVDWHESHKMLKAAFPVRVNAQRATYEIQYGHAERPTHYNTSWDLARFEVCAHKWVDLSEGAWGVALINESKYGHDILGNTIRLTLLRSPKAPDPEADMGRHEFTYWLYPHKGDFRQADVIGAANRLNSPVRLSPDGAASGSLVQVEAEGPKVVLEALKRAEDDDSIIARFYEAHNARGRARIRFGFPVSSAAACDLLERDIRPLPVQDGCVELDIRPFEIVSLKLR